MEQHELLRYVASTLDRLGIPYFVTGSFAGILYGPYRMTNDLDVVIRFPRERVDEFLAAFPSDQFYVDRDAMLDAIRTRMQFNVIHQVSLAKVDFIAAGGPAHDREYQRIRRIRGTVDYEVAYCSPEDLILKKLEYHRDSDSEKHLTDVAGILKVSGPTLDMDYLATWAVRLDVLRSWRKALALAGVARQG